MKHLQINPTINTPLIDFNTNGNLLIKGISTPEDIVEFYEPIFKWINEFKETKKEINFTMFIEYLNTSSSSTITDLLLLLKSIKEDGVNVNFIWKYEDDDDDMKEMGEELELITGIKFEFQKITVN